MLDTPVSESESKSRTTLLASPRFNTVAVRSTITFALSVSDKILVTATPGFPALSVNAIENGTDPSSSSVRIVL